MLECNLKCTHHSIIISGYMTYPAIPSSTRHPLHPMYGPLFSPICGPLFGPICGPLFGPMCGPLFGKISL